MDSSISASNPNSFSSSLSGPKSWISTEESWEKARESVQIDIKNQKEQNEPIDMFPTTIPMLIQRGMGFGGNQEGGPFYTCKISSSRADEDSLKLEVRRGKNEHATSTIRVAFLTLAAITSKFRRDGSVNEDGDL